jgi:hypothetical protein
VVQSLEVVGQPLTPSGPVLVEADDLTHGPTVPLGSDTLQDPSGSSTQRSSRGASGASGS